LRTNISKAVGRLVEDDHRVWRVILFGSVAERRATPASDVDLVVVVTGSDRPVHERSLPYVKYFAGIGLGTDLFVYTRDEVRSLDIPLYRTAFKRGELLFERRTTPGP